MSLMIMLILIVIALLLACALRIVCRGAALSSSSSPRAVADDPFFYPFGEMPSVPGERARLFQPERVKPVFGRAERTRDANSFRNWGIPNRASFLLAGSDAPRLDAATERRFLHFTPSAAVAHQRKESGGRPSSTPGTAVVLTFPKRGA